MKNYIQYIPLTTFAATIALGGSLSAEEAASEGTSMREQQRQSQQSARTSDETARERTTEQASSQPMSASEVLGMNIDSAENEKIGEIDEIYVDSTTGEVLAMVVSTGGLLGIGQQQSLISPQDLRINAERTLMQTDISKEEIRSAPRYREGERTGFDQVRPLGKSASDGEARTQRSDRTAGEQHASDRRRAGEERTERAEGERHASDRQTADQERTQRSERTEGEQHASDRRRAGEERTERADRTEGEQSQVRALAVSELIGMSVENRQGEAVGDVDEAFLDLENWEVAGVVVSTGGFLGIGDRKTLFGMQEMSFDSENENIVLDYNRDQISEFPEFEADEQSVFEDLRERMNRTVSRSNGSAAVEQ